MNKKGITIILSCIIAILLIITIVVCVLLFVKPNDNTNTPSLPNGNHIDNNNGNNSGNNNGNNDNNSGSNGENNKVYSIIQNLNYEESIEKINNPDQGFYYPVYIKIGESGLLKSQTDSVLNQQKNNYQLYHLRVDISNLSGKINGIQDYYFSEYAKLALRQELEKYRQMNKSVIIRFAYDPDFAGDNFNCSEPEFSMLLQHVVDICGVLNEYEDVLTAVEAGMIGKWGEMTSASNYMSAKYYTPLIETFLSNTKNLFVLVRTPQMIYDYANISNKDILLGKTIEFDEKSKRLGFYNDAFMYNWNDYGTYKQISSIDGIEGTNGNTCRYVHAEIIKQFTAHTGFGGEALKPVGTLSDIKQCLPEMYNLHLSYLNGIYEKEVMDMWKSQIYNSDCELGDKEIYHNQTAYRYIENHMGYRLVLTKSVFEYTNKYDCLLVKLNLNNTGFGNFNKSKNAKLIFVNEKNEVVQESIVGKYNGESVITYSTNMNLQNGNYKVYLCLFSNQANNPTYCVQFANNGVQYNKTLGANLVGEITIKK